jgi:hypothetical protein
MKKYDTVADDVVTAYTASSSAPVNGIVTGVESTVVLIMGMDDVAEGLEYRKERKTIARATEAGMLDGLLDEVDRLRVSGIVGRELQRRVENWLDVMLDAGLTSNEAPPQKGIAPGFREGADEPDDVGELFGQA